MSKEDFWRSEPEKSSLNFLHKFSEIGESDFLAFFRIFSSQNQVVGFFGLVFDPKIASKMALRRFLKMRKRVQKGKKRGQKFLGGGPGFLDFGSCADFWISAFCKLSGQIF